MTNRPQYIGGTCEIGVVRGDRFAAERLDTLLLEPFPESRADRDVTLGDRAGRGCAGQALVSL